MVSTTASINSSNQRTDEHSEFASLRQLLARHERQIKSLQTELNSAVLSSTSQDQQQHQQQHDDHQQHQQELQALQNTIASLQSELDRLALENAGSEADTNETVRVAQEIAEQARRARRAAEAALFESQRSYEELAEKADRERELQARDIRSLREELSVKIQSSQVDSETARRLQDELDAASQQLETAARVQDELERTKSSLATARADESRIADELSKMKEQLDASLERVRELEEEAGDTKLTTNQQLERVKRDLSTARAESTEARRAEEACRSETIALKREQEAAQNQVDAADDRARLCDERYKQLQEREQELSKRANDLAKEVSKIRQEAREAADEASKRYEESQRATVAAVKRAQEAEKSAAEAEQRAQAVESESSSAKADASSARQDAESAKEDARLAREEARAAMKASKKVAADSEQRITEFNSRLQVIEEEKRDAYVAVEAAKKDLVTATQATNECRKKYTKWKQKASQCQSRVEELEADVRIHQARADAESQRATQLDELLEQQQQQSSELTATSSKYQEERNEALGRVAALEVQHRECSEKLATTTARVVSLETRVRELEEEIASITATTASTREELVAAKQNIQKLEKRIATLDRLYKEADSAKRSAQQAIVKEQAKASTAVEKSRKATELLKKAKRKAKECDEKKSLWADQLKTAHALTQSKEQEVSKCTAEYANYQQTSSKLLQNCNKELVATKRTNSTLMEENQRYKVENAKLVAAEAAQNKSARELAGYRGRITTDVKIQSDMIKKIIAMPNAKGAVSDVSSTVRVPVSMLTELDRLQKLISATEKYARKKQALADKEETTTTTTTTTNKKSNKKKKKKTKAVASEPQGKPKRTRKRAADTQQEEQQPNQRRLTNVLPMHRLGEVYGMDVGSILPSGDSHARQQMIEQVQAMDNWLVRYGVRAATARVFIILAHRSQTYKDVDYRIAADRWLREVANIQRIHSETQTDTALTTDVERTARFVTMVLHQINFDGDWTRTGAAPQSCFWNELGRNFILSLVETNKCMCACMTTYVCAAIQTVDTDNDLYAPYWVACDYEKHISSLIISNVVRADANYIDTSKEPFKSRCANSLVISATESDKQKHPSKYSSLCDMPSQRSRPWMKVIPFAMIDNGFADEDNNPTNTHVQATIPSPPGGRTTATDRDAFRVFLPQKHATSKHVRIAYEDKFNQECPLTKGMIPSNLTHMYIALSVIVPSRTIASKLVAITTLATVYDWPSELRDIMLNVSSAVIRSRLISKHLQNSTTMADAEKMLATANSKENRTQPQTPTALKQWKKRRAKFKMLYEEFETYIHQPGVASELVRGQNNDRYMLAVEKLINNEQRYAQDKTPQRFSPTIFSQLTMLSLLTNHTTKAVATEFPALAFPHDLVY